MNIFKMAVLGLATSAAMAGPAAAGTGTAEFFGAFGVDGSIRIASGVTGVSKSSTGIFVITFPRVVSQCLWTTSILGRTAGLSTIVTVSGQPTRLEVRTYSAGGVLSDRIFTLAVKCQD